MPCANLKFPKCSLDIGDLKGTKICYEFLMKKFEKV